MLSEIQLFKLLQPEIVTHLGKEHFCVRNGSASCCVSKNHSVVNKNLHYTITEDAGPWSQS